MIAAFLCLLAAHAQAGPKLPDFPSGWRGLAPLSTELHEGTPVARLEPAAVGQQFNATGVALSGLPADKEITLSVWLRRKGGAESAQINAFSYAFGMRSTGMYPTTVALRDGEWTLGNAKFTAPAGTQTLQLWIINTGKTPLDISAPTLSIGGLRIVALNGSGILRASAGTSVTGRTGVIRFPIPGPYRDQAPITFKISSKPPSALTGWRITRRTKENWICEAEIAPPASGSATVRWESLVLVRPSAPNPLPKAPLSNAPNELSPWLRSSPVAQSDDAAIRTKATEIKKSCSDLQEFATRVIAFTSQNEGTGQTFASLDAKAALGCGGSCTSRANLAVALLRAGGVPARSVSHLPTWAYGSPLYEHWLVEYWHPGAGWTWLESTMGQVRPDPSTVAVLAVSTIEDELAAGTDQEYAWIMPGAAYMAGIQGFGGLTPALGQSSGDNNWCQPARRLQVSSDLLDAAKRAWPASAKSTLPLERTALAASPLELLKLLRRLATSSKRP